MCVHGGSPAAVKSITHDFFFMSLDYKTEQGIAEISRSSEKPALVFVLSFSAANVASKTKYIRTESAPV